MYSSFAIWSELLLQCSPTLSESVAVTASFVYATKLRTSRTSVQQLLVGIGANKNAMDAQTLHSLVPTYINTPHTATCPTPTRPTHSQSY
ncbi:hypothetical protein EDB89DRAFT_2026139, partial [Lactarius sanguifluus]